MIGLPSYFLVQFKPLHNQQPFVSFTDLLWSSCSTQGYQWHFETRCWLWSKNWGC